MTERGPMEAIIILYQKGIETAYVARGTGWMDLQDAGMGDLAMSKIIMFFSIHYLT